VGEPLHRHGVAVVDGRRDGVSQRHDLRHALLPSVSTALIPPISRIWAL
jgi:hypothetical protein